MKLTKSKLQQIIKEEVQNLLENSKKGWTDSEGVLHPVGWAAGEQKESDKAYKRDARYRQWVDSGGIPYGKISKDPRAIITRPFTSDADIRYSTYLRFKLRRSSNGELK